MLFKKQISCHYVRRGLFGLKMGHIGMMRLVITFDSIIPFYRTMMGMNVEISRIILRTAFRMNLVSCARL